MHKGDTNQEDLPITSEEIPETLGPIEAIHTTTLESSHQITNYYDAVKVLSEVELPPPTPVLAITGSLIEESNVMRFHEGQSSGTKRKADETEGNVERERELKNQQHDFRDPGHKRVKTDIIAKDKRRRNLISERITALRALVPNCNKRDKASILSEAIEYIKYLQMQVQAMSTQGVYMFPTSQPSWQLPNTGPPFSVRPLIEGIPQYGFYVPANIQVFPPPYSPLMPPMEVGSSGSLAWRQPTTSRLLYPQQLQFPSQQTSFGASSSIPTTSSQAESRVPGQPSHHVPVTTQGT